MDSRTHEARAGLLGQTSLVRYVENQVLRDAPVVSPNWLLTVTRVSLAVVGALWGLSTIYADEFSADLFKNQAARNAFSYIFAIGSMITVGANGLWIMLQNGNRLKDIKCPLEVESFINFVAPFGLVAFSLAPAVINYRNAESSLARTLALLGILCSLGYGYFGYSLILEKLSSAVSYINDLRIGDRAALRTKQTLLEHIDVLLNGATGNLLANVDSVSNFTNYLLNVIQSQRDNAVKKMIQLVSSLLITLSAGVVEFFVLRNLILDEISHDSISYFFLVCTILPAMAIHFMATHDVSGRLYEVIAHGNPFNPALRAVAPVIAVAIPIISTLIALMGTLEVGIITGVENRGNLGVAIVSGIVAFAASSIFSNFTLNQLGNMATITVAEKKDPQVATYMQERRKLEGLHEEVAKSPLTFFTATALKMPASEPSMDVVA